MWTLRQWLPRIVSDRRPRNIHGRICSPFDPENWVSYDEAMAATGAAGFAITTGSGYWCLDLDDQLLPDNTWSPAAIDMCTRLHGCYMEVSQSGTGIHIIGRGEPPERGIQNGPGGFYSSSRFVAITRKGEKGDPNFTPAPEVLQEIANKYFPVRAGAATSAEWTTEPSPDWSGPEEDEDLIARMLRANKSAKAVFDKSGPTLSDLWNATGLERFYPHSTKEFDWSAADSALCLHLAFWTGKDCERIERLWGLSELGKREKYEREDYRRRTILHAISLCSRVYRQPGRPTTKGGVSKPAKGVDKEGYQYLSIADQVEKFAGCVYVRDSHRMFLPEGVMLKPDQFRAHFGGYFFALDNDGKKVTRNAWEAFTECRGHMFPRVHGTCFRPELPPGEIIETEGLSYVNTYVPIETTSRQGDPSPFLNHLAKMLPVQSDRDILLAYMAAMLQYPGKKFGWAPVIQGTEGNGKTLLINVLSHAVGKRYTHLPNASELGGGGSKFNAWVEGRLFIGIEEIHVSNRREVADALKPLITNPRVEIQGKGRDQYTGDNRANFLLCSNHRDCVLKHRGDRRYAVFFTAQQTIDDMVKEGWVTTGGEPTRYFYDLYSWCERGGYEIVANYLKNYQIPDVLNPATLCHRAPITSSQEAAIEASYGPVEQRIMEAVAEERTGFRGGWVSSLRLQALLQEHGLLRSATPNRWKAIMESLGYTARGRASAVIPEEGGRPRLYYLIGKEPNKEYLEENK